MSIASEITRLQEAKADIKEAIENKGVTVASNLTLSSYAPLIDSIQSGGSVENGTLLNLTANENISANNFIEFGHKEVNIPSPYQVMCIYYLDNGNLLCLYHTSSDSTKHLGEFNPVTGTMVRNISLSMTGTRSFAIKKCGDYLIIAMADGSAYTVHCLVKFTDSEMTLYSGTVTPIADGQGYCKLDDGVLVSEDANEAYFFTLNIRTNTNSCPQGVYTKLDKTTNSYTLVETKNISNQVQQSGRYMNIACILNVSNTWKAVFCNSSNIATYTLTFTTTGFSYGTYVNITSGYSSMHLVKAGDKVRVFGYKDSRYHNFTLTVETGTGYTISEEVNLNLPYMNILNVNTGVVMLTCGDYTITVMDYRNNYNSAFVNLYCTITKNANLLFSKHLDYQGFLPLNDSGSSRGQQPTCNNSQVAFLTDNIFNDSLYTLKLYSVYLGKLYDGDMTISKPVTINDNKVDGLLTTDVTIGNTGATYIF